MTSHPGWGWEKSLIFFYNAMDLCCVHFSPTVSQCVWWGGGGGGIRGNPMDLKMVSHVIFWSSPVVEGMNGG